jgi:hypothetical protein
MKRIAHNRYITSIRALDNRNVFLLRWPGSDTLMLGTAEGSTYISKSGLRKLKRDIDAHLAAEKPRAPRRRK